MSMFHVDRDGALAVVRLDRPPANALTTAFFVELVAVLDRLATPDVRALVLTGTGSFFSAGLDLFEVFADGTDFDAFATAFDRGFGELFAYPKPVVAAINGHAIAGGAVIAAAADFRLMADGKGKVGLTEILLGMSFPAAALELVRCGCAGPALPELLYRGLTYPPAEALARRLVDEVVAPDELLPRAKALARELGAFEPSAFASTKQALRAEFRARLASHAPGHDPVWHQWRSPATREAIADYRTRTLAAKRQ